MEKICEALIKSPTKCQAINKPGTPRSKFPVAYIFGVPGKAAAWAEEAAEGNCPCLQGGRFTSGFSISPFFTDILSRDIRFAGNSKRHGFESEF